MTIKDLYEILEDMINDGLGDVEIISANDSESGDRVADAGMTMSDEFGIWWK